MRQSKNVGGSVCTNKALIDVDGELQVKNLVDRVDSNVKESVPKEQREGCDLCPIASSPCTFKAQPRRLKATEPW
eukprot:1153901-Pelagomonas_calceolata.AAC.5